MSAKQLTRAVWNGWLERWARALTPQLRNNPGEVLRSALDPWFARGPELTKRRRGPFTYPKGRALLRRLR